MHQFCFPLQLRPDPAGGSLHHSPDPLAVFKGPASNGREGKEREERRDEEKVKGGKGTGGGGRDLAHPKVLAWRAL